MKVPQCEYLHLHEDTVRRIKQTLPPQEQLYRLSELYKVFGDGTVVAVKPMANDAMLEVKFDTAGTKKIMANFTPITKLN